MAFNQKEFDAAVKAIKYERKYQDKKWNNTYDDNDWSINDWVVFIRQYLDMVNANTGQPEAQMDNMRKVAALAVAAMEHKGVVRRA